jgi:hypothetical protein
MQRFTLIHDGTSQAWQTTYLAFHIAARLGAPLQVLLADSMVGEEPPSQRATDIEVGGRAAGVVIESRLITDFAMETILENTSVVDGLFIPRRLLPDDETVKRFLNALSCPLWIVSKETETRQMAVLVGDLSEEEDLVNYAGMLSRRLGGSLSGLLVGDTLPIIADDAMGLEWMLLQDFSVPAVVSAINYIQADLLFIHSSRASLIKESTCTCVVYPKLTMLK